MFLHTRNILPRQRILKLKGVAFQIKPGFEGPNFLTEGRVETLRDQRTAQDKPHNETPPIGKS